MFSFAISVQQKYMHTSCVWGGLCLSIVTLPMKLSAGPQNEVSGIKCTLCSPQYQSPSYTTDSKTLCYLSLHSVVAFLRFDRDPQEIWVDEDVGVATFCLVLHVLVPTQAAIWANVSSDGFPVPEPINAIGIFCEAKCKSQLTICSK